MKKVFISAILVFVFGFQLFAQEATAIQKNRTKSNANNEKKASSSVCVVTLKCTDKSCDVNYFNTEDAKSEMGVAYKGSNPIIIAKQSDGIPVIDNTVDQTRDAESAMVTGKMAPDPNVTNVTGKVMCDNKWSTSQKIVLVNGQYTLPVNCTNSRSEVELAWSWGASTAASDKSYTSAKLILTMKNGVCTEMVINDKGTTSTNSSAK